MTCNRTKNPTRLHLAGLGDSMLREIGVELQKQPDLAPEVAAFAGRLQDICREAAQEQSAAERRSRRSNVIRVNMKHGRTIMPTAEYPDLAEEYNA